MVQEGLNRIMKSKKPFKLFEIVKVFDLAPIAIPDPAGESFKFRIEILKDCQNDGHFYARVCRRETFRLQPTFPLDDDGRPKDDCFDEEIVIQDISQKWENIKGKTAEEVLEKVLNKIREIFNL